MSIPSDQNPFSENPYAAPMSTDDPSVSAAGSSEEIRRAHIAHEASIKSVGCLYSFGGVMLIVAAIVLIAQAILVLQASNTLRRNTGPAENVVVAAIAFAYVAIGTAQIATALGMRGLKPWARWAGVGFSVLGLLGFPCGTIISGYILYLLLSKKGEFIFSEPYKQIIRDTPDVKYRTSKVVWAALIVLILVIVGIFVIGFAAS